MATSCTKWRLWWRLFFSATDILTTRGTRASLPANGPDPAAATGTLLSLVFSWHGQLARVPRPVRNKRLHWPLSLPLSFLCLALPILPPLPSPPVLDAGIWSKGLSLSWGLETDHLLLAENSNSGSVLVWFLERPSSSPPYSGSPGKSPVRPARVSAGGRRRL